MAERSAEQKKNDLRAVGRDLSRFDWSKANARAGLRCLPGLLIPLALGLATGRLSEGVTAAAAALSVGFGSFQSLRESRVRVMLLVTAVITVAAFSGSLGSRSVWGVLLAAGGWALLYGLLTAMEGALSWIGLQSVIIAVVAGGFPVGPAHALLRAGLTLAGGLLQTGLILAIWRILGPPREPVSGPPVSLPAEQGESRFHTLQLHLSPGTPVGRFTWQLALTLLVAAAVYQELHLRNGYWVPVTAVIVLRPEFHLTVTRGLARLAGTLLGVGLASLIAEILRPHAAVLAVLVLVFAWASYALVRVNYGLFAVCITAYVVFLLSFVGVPERSIILYRLLNTTVGGVLAIGASLLPLERLANGSGRASANREERGEGGNGGPRALGGSGLG